VGKPCVHHAAMAQQDKITTIDGLSTAGSSCSLILGPDPGARLGGDRDCSPGKSATQDAAAQTPFLATISKSSALGCFRWAHGASLRIYVIVRSWNTTTLLVKNGCKRLSPRLDQTRKSRRKSDSAKLPIIVERSNVIPVITRRPWGRTSPADIPPLRFSPGVAPAPSWRQNLLRPPSF
jgi:hypothetical protein